MKPKYLIISFALLFLNSCEKEININLNKNNPKYVIEGNLSTEIGESRVKITQTLNFNETDSFPTVSGALVTITDNTQNKIDTLSEIQAGIYNNLSLVGIKGHAYTMTVKIGSEIFTSISTIPYSLTLDSLVQLNLAGTGGQGRPGSNESGSIIRILPVYTNSTNSDKYFQFIVVKNDTILYGIIARSDLVSNGYSIPFPFFIRANKNDIIKIDMQFIDKQVYDYLFGLTENINQFSATPANPTSNISNGALGYFKAHTSQKEIMVIK